MSPCPRAIDTGAYVLGALEPQERAAFEEHLRSCDHCRREVAELRVAAEALPLTAEPVDPPAELRDRIMDVVRAEARPRDEGAQAGRRARGAARARGRRSKMGRAPLAVAACALLALGVALGALVASGGDDAEGGARSVQADVTVAGASGTLRVEDDGDARLVVQGLPAPPAGRVYQVWRQRPGEDVPRPTDALFSVSRDGTATVDVPGGVEGVERVLVSDEPRRGSRAPTGEVVLTAAPA